MTAREFHQYEDGDWVSFRHIEGDKTYIECGQVTLPTKDDHDMGLPEDHVFIFSEDLSRYHGTDEWPEGKPVHEDLIEERLGDHNYMEEKGREEANEYMDMVKSAYDDYRRR